MRFYNGLSEASKRLFRPIGIRADLATCEAIGRDNEVTGGDKYDLILTLGDEIVGWCFIWGLHGDRPSLGLGIADGHQGRGLGETMMSAIMHWARQRRLPAVHLTVVQENAVARRLYESFGFVVHSERISEVDGLCYCNMSAVLRPGENDN